MCEQFAIEGAIYNVIPTAELSIDFSPVHHAPRNIPISVVLPNNVKTFIHFPIVEVGRYFIYATDPTRLGGLKEKNGEPIEASRLEAAPSCADVLTGGLSADIELGDVTGPKPVAIELSAGNASTLRLIVSRTPINVVR